MLVQIVRRGNFRERWARLNRWQKAMWVCGLTGVLAVLSSIVLVRLDVDIALGPVGTMLFYGGYGLMGCGAVCAVMAGVHAARTSR